MEERTDKFWTHADPHHGQSQFALEIGQVQGSKVGELHPLEVAPEPFVRVEFGSVSREVLDAESGTMLLKEVANREGPVSVDVESVEKGTAAFMECPLCPSDPGRQTTNMAFQGLGSGFFYRLVIPDQNDGAVDVPQEVAQENEHLGCGDGTGSDEDKEPGVGTHSGDSRELRPGTPVDEDRGLAAGRPGAHSGRHQPECRFVGEDQRDPKLLGFFLIRGHSTATQRRIAPSSRSEARLVGR